MHRRWWQRHARGQVVPGPRVVFTDADLDLLWAALGRQP